MSINYSEIEAKWQKAWNDANAYETEPSDAPALMVNPAFPYVNTPQHIGHLRTYGTADVYARYMRLRGHNVLYPMGFHATGTPILGIAKRIANKDPALIAELKAFEIPDDIIAKMNDPIFIVDYMIKVFEEGMKLSGLGIDWRRKFVSIEPIFSKMVEWQFSKLNEKGLLKQGNHPVGWCPNEGNPVGQHDTKGDVDPEIEELAAVCFKDSESDVYFPCATYRPETIYGVTNLFISESFEYVIASINGTKYYLSKESATKLGYQMKVVVEQTIDPVSLFKRRAINPVNKELLPLLPGFFVKAEIGTGIVMSVPTHAPFDYAALESLKLSGYIVPLDYRQVIKIERPDSKPATKEEIERARKGDNNVSAQSYLEMIKSEQNPTDEMLEYATKLVYREESRWGVMLLGKYVGKPEQEARDKIKEDLVASGDAFKIYELVNEKPVICRCGTRVVVKSVEGQWFINYGDAKWKDDVRAHMKNMNFYPPNSINTFDKVVDWIGMKATERAQGLGTPFPLNKDHIIESLSDSTIYMSLYTYIHILREANVKPEQLKFEFFDFVLCGKGSAASVASATGIDEIAIKRCREEFAYWYSFTSRHSGSDLVYNHLTMYMFNHLAIFPKENWPKQIVTNGLVSYEGQKMSKSLGNIVPLKIGIRKHGADLLRFVEIVTADLGTESDFKVDSVNSIRLKNEAIAKLVESLSNLKSVELSHNDFWLYSKLNSKIKMATMLLDALKFKEAYIEIYYNSINELRRYQEHGGVNELVMREFLEKLAIMLSPIMPHFAEEMWQILGKTEFVVKQHWPEFDKGMINLEEEKIEEIIDSTISDARQIIDLTSKANTGKKLRQVKIIIADEWKGAAFNMLAKEKNISKVIADDAFKEIDKEKLSKFLSQFAKKLNTLQEVQVVNSENLIKAFGSSETYIADRLGTYMVISNEADSNSPRADRALTDKPAIEIIWE